MRSWGKSGFLGKILNFTEHTADAGGHHFPGIARVGGGLGSAPLPGSRSHLGGASGQGGGEAGGLAGWGRWTALPSWAGGCAPHVCCLPACKPEVKASVMGVCIVLHRRYCVCLKTKKKDVPFQHGKGRFQATRQEGTKQLSQSEKCRLPVSLRAGSRPRAGRPAHPPGGQRTACWAPGAQLEATPPPLRPPGSARGGEDAGPAGHGSKVPEGGPPGVASRASQRQRWKGIVAEPRTDGQAGRPCTLCIWPCGLCVSGHQVLGSDLLTPGC